MKKQILFIALVLSCYSAISQVNITLHMDQKLGGNPFAYNMPAVAPMGYAFTMTRMQYYISEIKLIHDGGIVTTIADLHFLVDPSVDRDFSLGEHAINSLEQIQFSIGVDPAHNHLDPATYPADHPLAPQNPSMHWGWVSGYRFIAIEGFAGADSNSMNNNYQIHTVGDENYKIVSMDVAGVKNGNEMGIYIQADYEKFLDDIDASNGLISHSASGASNTIAVNSRIVFSPVELTAVNDTDIKGSIVISPNPVKDVANVQYQMQGYGPLFLSITDLMGRQVYSTSLNDTYGSFDLHMNWPAGMYITRLFNTEQIFAIEKVIIQ